MVRSVKRRGSSTTAANVNSNNVNKENDKRKKVSNSGLDENPLCKLLMNYGFVFPVEKEKPNELHVDQAIFQQKLCSAFKKGRDKLVGSVINGLEELWGDNYRFCFSILPTISSEDCCNSSRGTKQDSLIHILLGVDALQPQVINSILEKLPDINMNTELTKIAVSIGDMDLVHRLLTQLRWQDKIINSKELVSKVFEIISVSDTAVQKELISCIPDFIEDVDHMDVATQLSQLLLENSHLVSSLVDALNNLNLRGDVLNQIQDAVLKILDSADIVDLPLVVKFLQQSLTDTNKAYEIISILREKLDFKSIVIPQDSSTQRNGQNKNALRKTRSDESIIFDVVKTGMRFQKILGDSWVKVIESVTNHKEHKIIDIFVLLVLHNMKSRSKSVDTLVRNKVKSGKFTEEVVTAAFNSYPQIFNEHIKEVLIIGDILLRSPEILISNYGCNIYKQAFCSFDLYSQQEVIGALVTHIGSGHGPEVEAAFAALESLVNSHTVKMSSFTIFLKGILDYIDNLSVSHIRILFSMISKLCFATDETSESVMNDDMYVIIRKQLSSASLKYKRIGIIGSVIIVGNMAAKKLDVDFSRTLPDGEGPSKELSGDVYKQIVEILTMVKGSVKGKPGPSSIFYDELGNVIEGGDVDLKILTWIQENIVSEFQDEFLIDSEVVKKNTDPQVGLVYDLDETEDAGIAVNILPMLLSDLQAASNEAGSSTASPHSKNKLIFLPALFRLLRICEQGQNKGNIEGIDALLGCPLVLFGEDALNQYLAMKEQDRIVVCSSLFYAINWFREALNAFCGEKVDADTRAKIICRIKTLSTLSNSLEKCLTITPNFNIPISDYSIDEKLLADIKPLKKILEGGKRPKKLIKKAKPKKKESKEVKDASTTCVEDDTNVLENGSDKEGDEFCGKDMFSESLVSLSMFPASLRQLDLQVFYALSYGSVSKKYMDSENHTNNKEEIKLEPADMAFLLRDLLSKMNHSLLGETRRCFLKVSATKLIGFSHLPTDRKFISFMIKLLPSLWSQLQACIAYFRERSESCDGIVDITLGGQDNKEYIKLYQHLLQSMLTLLQWDGFRNGKNQKVLKSILINIVSETSKIDITSSSSLQTLIKETFESLVISEKLVPSIHIAVTLIKIQSTLLLWCEANSNLQMKTKEMVLKLLKYTWVDLDRKKEKGSKFNESLSWLLKKYINISEEPLSAIEGFCDGPIAELRECKTSSEEGTSTFPCMNKASFTSVYKSLFEELLTYTKSESSATIVMVDRTIVSSRLQFMQTSLKLFQSLNSVTKEMDSRTNLIVSLKYSRLYLEVFLKSVMPLLDKTFRTHKDIVHSILKIAQQSTRSLQHLCSHSKFSKDVSMTTHVPGLKKCLETFVFRVKAVLAYNNCDSAFWLGNLKNRDLQGNEILSQVPAESGSEDDNDDEPTSSVRPEEDEVVGEDEDDNDEEMNEECSHSF